MTRKYGAWAGNPNGNLEDNTRCVVEVREPGRWINYYQCGRKRGYGPNGLYCKQHAKMKEEGRLYWGDKGEENGH